MNTLFIANNRTISSDHMGTPPSAARQMTVVIDIDGLGKTTSSVSDTTSEPEYFMKTPPVVSTNTTGIRGVSKVKHGYRADITRNGVQTNLGTYDSFQDAVEARLVAQWGLK